jgi:fructose-1,6-bisphosphatase/inositol monophosphatase family enzyme
LVAAWESGRAQPKAQQVRAIAKALRISPEALQPTVRGLATDINLTALAQEIVRSGNELCQDLSEILHSGAFTPVLRDQQEDDWQNDPSLRARQALAWQEDLDLYAHVRFESLIRERLLPFFPKGLILISEESLDEGGRLKPYVLPHGRDAAQIDHYVVLDPIDRTIEATRAITGFASLTVGSFACGPLVSAVFTLFDRYAICYYAITDEGAWVHFRDGTTDPLFPSEATELSGANLAAYISKPSRLTAIAGYDRLFERHGSESALTDASGSYGFCLVASSRVDAFFEVAKGYAWHDIVSGAHILKEAGGIVKALDFNDLEDPLLGLPLVESNAEYRLDLLEKVSAALSLPAAPDKNHVVRRLRRFPFIAAGTSDLGAKVALELGRSSPLPSHR